MNTTNNIKRKAKSKRMKSQYLAINRDEILDITKAIELIKSTSKVKFDESLEVSLSLGVDPRHSDQMVRGVVSMPHGTGKVIRVAVFAKENKQAEALNAGADLVGSDDLIEKVKAGEINFDRCIATPDMMASLGAIAKILGPKGLMPNPKLGTVTMNVGEAVKLVKGGQVEFRVEKAGIIHAGFGKLSFATEKLAENLKTLIAAVIKAKPSGAKGTYLKHAYICSTMSAACKLDLSSI